MSNRPWTEYALLQDLLTRFRSADTTLELCLLDSGKMYACSSKDGRKIRIWHDPSQDGFVPNIIHEMLHHEPLQSVWNHFGTKLEEAMVSGLERQLVEYVRFRPTLMRRWRNAGMRKIGECNGGKASGPA
jgi:hypothetical protein